MLLLGGALLSGCGTPDRPTRGEWRRAWADIQEVVPPPSQLEDPVADETCGEVLGALRRYRRELTPAPDDVIQNAAEAWVSHAEHMFVDCFDTSRRQEAIAEEYDKLEQLRAQVDAAPADR